MDESIIEIGLIDDEEIILDEAALSLALLDHPDAAPDRYEEILEAIGERIADRIADSGAASDRDRATLLAEVIGEEFGFTGDRETYDHPDNADLIRVIERRRGLPVALSIIYVAAARRAGWHAHALDVPGHVLVLIGGESAPVIVDPFRGGISVSANELAALVAAGHGGGVPLIRQVATMPNRAILVRLLLNQATRAEAAGDAARALILYQRITAFAPQHGHGWWERARLELGEGNVPAARSSLTAMLETTRDASARAEVTRALAALPA